MSDDKFEWDDAKADANYSKHGVDFETATETFADPFAIERADLSHAGNGEERFLITGMAAGRLLTVIFTTRRESYKARA